MVGHPTGHIQWVAIRRWLNYTVQICWLFYKGGLLIQLLLYTGFTVLAKLACLLQIESLSISVSALRETSKGFAAIASNKVSLISYSGFSQIQSKQNCYCACILKELKHYTCDNFRCTEFARLCTSLCLGMQFMVKRNLWSRVHDVQILAHQHYCLH